MIPARVIRSLLSVSLTLLTIAGCKRDHPADSVSPPPATVRVAAAADLKFALDQVVIDFRQAHPNIAVTPTYGASGNFYEQLSRKAPFDIYLSADVRYPEKLAQQGLADKSGVFHYARGQIVLWVPSSSTLDLDKLKMRALLDPAVKKIAIANPDHAPYGRAAVAAMKSAGVFDDATPRIVHGENIAQTAQMAETGAVDIAIIADSLAVAPAMKDRGRYWAIPTESYPPIDQGGVILGWANDADAARQFKEFLTGPKGKATLQQFGFSVE